MEILDTFTKTHGEPWLLLPICVCLLASAYIYSITKDCCDNPKVKFIVSPIVWTISIIFFVLLFTGHFTTEVKRYIVRVDETVTVHEFYEKYDVKEKKDYADVFEVESREKHAEE